MLTVNSDKNPVKVTFSGLVGFDETAVLSEDRKVKIVDGKFTDSYKPFDVHIYKIK